MGRASPYPLRWTAIISFPLVFTGCIQTKLMRWAHEEVKFTTIWPDADDIQYISPDDPRFSWPGNEKGIRIHFWIKNLESYEDGLYRLRIPAEWDRLPILDGKIHAIEDGLFRAVFPIDTPIERLAPSEGRRWGAGRRHEFLLDLREDPVRAELEDWQPRLQSGIYGIVSHTRIDGGARHHSYDIYGWHEGLGAWVKIRTLSLGRGTQWPYRRWVAVPLSVLAFPIDLPVFLLTFLIHPGLPFPEDLY